MIKNEIWKPHPEFPWVEVSTSGNVRTQDRVVSIKKGTYAVKGQVLKQCHVRGGYLRVGFSTGSKKVTKRVHRLVAETFIPNPNNWTEVNHKDCNPSNNCVSNLEWCTSEYNIKYREKYGKAQNHPVVAVNLITLDVLRFPSQKEAGRKLGIDHSRVSAVIKGKLKQVGGFWFTEDDSKIDRDKLRVIANGVQFRGGVFAINLKTQEVLRFDSQSGASRELGVPTSSIHSILKGRQKQTGGYWFVEDTDRATDIVKSKLHDIGGVGLKL